MFNSGRGMQSQERSCFNVLVYQYFLYSRFSSFPRQSLCPTFPLSRHLLSSFLLSITIPTLLMLPWYGQSHLSNLLLLFHPYITSLPFSSISSIPFLLSLFLSYTQISSFQAHSFYIPILPPSHISSLPSLCPPLPQFPCKQTDHSNTNL